MKQYTISDPLISIISPASTPESSPWQLSGFTNDPLQVGVRSVTLTVSLVDYPTVPVAVVNFILNVIDNCTNALINDGGQVLTTMTYIPMTATVETTQIVEPFSDNVAS